jgi:hypothetical protein
VGVSAEQDFSVKRDWCVLLFLDEALRFVSFNDIWCKVLHTVPEANKIIPCIPVDHLLFPGPYLLRISIQMEVCCQMRVKDNFV